MIQITLSDVQMAVTNLPNVPGAKVLQFADPKSGIVVVVPLPEQVCQEMVARLRPEIVVASGPLPAHDGARRGR